MSVYYNDHDPYVVEWARNLIKAGLVPDGEVDGRPIQEVRADDVRGFIQCHFFCGILGWALALQLAEYPGDRPIWTGSCPCQPFSAAGKQEGGNDSRHLWPEWYRIIRESWDRGQSGPERIVGEQVANAVGHGWLDAVSADLEAEAYTIGSVVLGAHSVGAFTIRQRLWWVAESGRQPARGSHPGPGQSAGSDGTRASSELGRSDATDIGLAKPVGPRVRDRGRGEDGEAAGRAESAGEERKRLWSDAGDGSLKLGSAVEPGLEGHPRNGDDGDQSGRLDTLTAGPASATGATGELGDAASGGRGELWDAPLAGSGRHPVGPSRAGPWGDIQWQPCRDGKVRPIPIEPSLHPLVARLSESVGGRGTATHRTITDEAGRPIRQEPWRIGMLRGSGNSIVPQVAAAFLRCLP